MAEEYYPIPEDPQYRAEIRKLQNSDPVNADAIINPLISRMIENTAAVKKQADAAQAITGKGAPTQETAGHLGQHYLNTETGQEYTCVAADGETGVYTWKESGGGGSGSVITITFDPEFEGRVFTVSGGRDTQTGIVPATLVVSVNAVSIGSTYIITSEINGAEYYTTVTVKQSSEAYTAALKAIRIYGVSWDGTATSTLSRTDDAALFTNPVPYVKGASSYGSPFDKLQPWAGMVKSERTGGTMVAIPKFWYKLTQNGKGLTVQIADKATAGFVASPAHMDRGDGKGERDVVYVGRYHCAEGSSYKSVTGKKPQADITRATARTEIHKLGNNIWQMDFATRFSLWLLYIVEFADWNSQKTIGKGCGNNSSTENMGYTDSMPYHTGTMQSSRDTYGVGTQYRNIEGLWDNVLQDWEDGCYNSSNGLMIILSPNSYSDNAGGVSIGTPSNGYPSAFSVTSNAGFPMFYPTEAKGSETTYSCDYWGFDASNPVVCVGGDYYQNGYRGLFFRSCHTVSDAIAGIGSRLHELP